MRIFHTKHYTCSLGRGRGGRLIVAVFIRPLLCTHRHKIFLCEGSSIDGAVNEDCSVSQSKTVANMSETRKRTPVKVFTREEVARHRSASDCWVIENGSVYDVSRFLDSHPGGAELITRHGGKDITHVMTDEMSHAHSGNAYTLLKEHKIGVLEENNNVEDEMFSMTGYKEELLDWNQGMVAQVHKLGDDYKKWVHSPVNKQLRLFNSDFIEFFSKTPWYMVPIIWLPVILYCFVVASHEIHETYTPLLVEDSENSDSHHGLTLAITTLCFGVGLPVWTLMEYVLHRYLFHIEPSTPSLITLHFFLHGQHHKVPFDGSRLVFPPIPAACLALPFHILFTYLFPGGVGRALFAGGLLGYVVYDLIHYYLHHGVPSKGSYLHSLKYYHVLHHFDDQATGYGISTKFWDYPFNTVNKKFWKNVS